MVELNGSVPAPSLLHTHVPHMHTSTAAEATAASSGMVLLSWAGGQARGTPTMGFGQGGCL